MVFSNGAQQSRELQNCSVFCGVKKLEVELNCNEYLDLLSDAGFQATSMKAGITKDLPVPSEWTDMMADEHETERDCVFEPESERGEDSVISNNKAVMEQMLEHSCVFYTEDYRVAVRVNDDYLGGEGNSMVSGEGLNWSKSSSVTCKCNVPVRRDNRGHLYELLHKAANEVDGAISRNDFSDGAHATAHSPVADTDDHVIVTDGQNVFVIDGLDSESGTAVNGCGVASCENGSRNKNSFGLYSAVEDSVPSIHHDHARLSDVFDSASFAANGSCQSPSVNRQPFFNNGHQQFSQHHASMGLNLSPISSVNRQPFFNNGHQQFSQHHASMGLNLSPISPLFSMCGIGSGTVSPSAAFSPSAVDMPYPVLLQTAEGTMLYSGPVSYTANPFLPYPVPVGVGLGSAMSPLSGQLFSQATSPAGVAGQQPLGYPTQLLAPAIVYGQSSNPAVFPVGFHSQSPSQVVFPISFHGQSSNQHHQVLLPVSVNTQASDELFMLGSVHEQTVQLDANVNILQKPKSRRWKLNRNGENGRTHPRKPKCSRKQLADIQNTSAQAQGEGETFRAQAEADEMIGGVSGPKKPRKRGGRPKSAASKSGKGSSVSSSGNVSVSSGQKSKGKRTPRTDATAKTG